MKPAPEVVAQLRGCVRASVVLTDNRVRVASVQRRRGGGLELRVARHFLASHGVAAIPPLVGFVHGDAEATAALRRLVRGVPAPPPGAPRRPALRPQGRVHSLVPILREEAEAHLGHVPAVGITWGARVRRRGGQRSVRLGSYQFVHQLVRVHRLLDDHRAPRWVVGFVVFHELLHHEVGVDASAPRRCVHPPEFRAREAAHPRFLDVKRWEREWLPRLLAGP